MLTLAWSILYVNTFSNIFIYKNIGDLFESFIYTYIYLCAFFIGYLFVSPNSYNQMTDKFKEFIPYNKSTIQHRLTIFPILSVLSFIFLFVDVALLLNYNFTDISYLRNTWNEKESASLFGQIASLISASGIFCITTFFFFKPKNKLLNFIGIIAFALGSILSGGRQQLFVTIIFIFLCIRIMKFYGIRVYISSKIKILLYVFTVLFFCYFIYLSNNRNVSSDDSRTAVEKFQQTNYVEINDEFSNVLNLFPAPMQSFIVELFFYFSHEIYSLAEQLDQKDISFIDFKIIRFFPFFERQIDKIFPTDDGLLARYQNLRTGIHLGYIDQTSWKTIVLSLLSHLGYLGFILVPVIHGYISRLLFYSVRIKPSFATLNLLIGNSCILFYTIMNFALAETFLLVFILLSLYYYFKD